MGHSTWKFLKKFTKSSKNVGNLQQFWDDLRWSLGNLQMTFGNLWRGSGDPQVILRGVQKCSELWYIKVFIYFGFVRCSNIIFGFKWTSTTFDIPRITIILLALKCLHVNFRNHCKLHLWYIFLLVWHLNTGVTFELCCS